MSKQPARKGGSGGVIFAPQETDLLATQRAIVPFWQDQEENREEFEVPRR
jgi:hypothetical protein